ncbi:MAG: hypothetical protein ACJ75Z_04030 [Solirubrobacterales bacterium]
MAVVVTQEFESTPEQYDQVTEKIDPGSNPPDGLLVHAGIELGGDKMKAVDVWESADKFQTFAETRLGPAIAEVIGPDAPEADVDIQEARTVVKP